MKQKEFYTAKELAEKLRVNIMTIYRHIGAKKLKAYKIGKDGQTIQNHQDPQAKHAYTVATERIKFFCHNGYAGQPRSIKYHSKYYR